MNIRSPYYWLPPQDKSVYDVSFIPNVHANRLFPQFCQEVLKGGLTLATRPVTTSRGRSAEAQYTHIVDEWSGQRDLKRVSLDRLSVVCWIKPVIEHAEAGSCDVLVWRDFTDKDKVKLVLADYSYIIILIDEGSVYGLQTAYPVTWNRMMEQLPKEYARWLTTHNKNDAWR
jgi:hypothetical protein